GEELDLHSGAEVDGNLNVGTLTVTGSATLNSAATVDSMSINEGSTLTAQDMTISGPTTLHLNATLDGQSMTFAWSVSLTNSSILTGRGALTFNRGLDIGSLSASVTSSTTISLSDITSVFGTLSSAGTTNTGSMDLHDGATIGGYLSNQGFIEQV